MDDYDEILKFYNVIDRTEQDTRKWCYQKVINLMFKLIDNPHKDKIINSLILMLNLFFIEFPDHYHNQGKRYLHLNKNERTHVLKILKKEIRG